MMQAVVNRIGINYEQAMLALTLLQVVDAIGGAVLLPNVYVFV